MCYITENIDFFLKSFLESLVIKNKYHIFTDSTSNIVSIRKKLTWEPLSTAWILAPQRVPFYIDYKLQTTK